MQILLRCYVGSIRHHIRYCQPGPGLKASLFRQPVCAGYIFYKDSIPAGGTRRSGPSKGWCVRASAANASRGLSRPAKITLLEPDPKANWETAALASVGVLQYILVVFGESNVRIITAQPLKVLSLVFPAMTRFIQKGVCLLSANPFSRKA